ncbi:MAG: PKD domain-containing protein, partial [Desulfobacteraceae bacterium]
MKKILSLFLASIFLAAFCISDAVAVSPKPGSNKTAAPSHFQKDPPHAKNRILIQLTENAASSSAFQNNAAGQNGILTGLPLLDNKMINFNVKARKRAYHNVKNRRMEKKLGVSRWYTLDVPENSDIKILIDQFKSDKDVADASPDWIAYPADAANDPNYSSQWGHHNTGQLKSYCWNCGGHPSGTAVGTPGFDGNVETAWTALGGYGDPNIVIAIVDTGVDIDHPDLTLVTGYDYGDNDANPDDNSADPGHGTACAGVAAATANNGIGTAGVAGGCSIMPLKVANSDGTMYFSAIQNALYYAADNGADVVSMSLGAALSSDAATDTAIAYAHNAGVTILAATGNENASAISYPANNPYVIAVGAANPCDGRKRSSSNSSEVNSGVSTDPNGYTCDGERWWGSNYGPSTPDANNAVDILAPTILPTTDIGGSGGYDAGDYSMWFNGTSCSTPFAAGVAGLIKSQHPGWTPSQVRQQIVLTARDVQNVESGAGWDKYSGYGMIDAGAALGSGSGNLSPTANANGPYTGDQGAAISFSSAGSFDNDGTIISYEWDFGDGNSSSIPNPSHTYANAGDYNVSLIVTDNAGATGTDYTTAKIAGICATHPLVLTIVLDRYPGETTWVIKNAAGSTIASGGPYSTASATISEDFCLPDGNYSFTIYDSYGDGICCAYGTGSYELAEGAVVYASGGSFTRSENTPFTLATTVNHPPTANAGGPYSGTAGQAVVFNGSGSSDTDGDTLTYAWTFGDGGSATGVNPSHTYAAAGTYTVTLTVDDGRGGTDSDQASANIASVPVNHPPTANAGGPYSGTAGQAVVFNGSGSSDTDGDTLTYAWTFGDGGSATGVNPSHTYAAAGTYTVTLTVDDGRGGTDSDQASASISATGGYTTLVYDDFETGWGNYTK